MHLTPNDYVEIKPTESGWESIVKYVDNFNAHLQKTQPKLKFRMSIPKENSEGYIRGQFWDLMGYFDWTKAIGSACPFSDLRISK
jgi:hypothetical protein